MLLKKPFFARFPRYFSEHPASSLPEPRRHNQNIIINSLIIKHYRSSFVPLSTSKPSHTISQSVTRQGKETGRVMSIILTSYTQSLRKQWYLLPPSLPFIIIVYFVTASHL
ncbi:hypothetical protein NA56DRAFT_350531 [Hyaloscypha hepaticicola]|uniref:Uncharacterized protein n=1 Tax=Hyaloscypha hepaticicola TaxID=2082293 RepID=A0A2J6PMQ0_9HELO|nr:hypothetical protein NA56DRAFT_350531 [Hyaloscypha hepaticicola]